MLFNIPDDVTVEAFFQEHLPARFQELTGGADLSFLQAQPLTLQFRVGDATYGLRVAGPDALEVVAGGVDVPLLELALGEADWRDSVSGRLEGVLDAFTDPARVAERARYEKLRATRGTLNLELRKPDGSTMPVTLRFNGAESPAVTMNIAIEDWVALQRRDVDGPSLFMSGKMKTQGDMMLLMSLQALL